MGEQIEEKIVVIKEEICIEEKTVNKIPEKMGEQIEDKIVVIKEEICIEEKAVNIYLQEESVKKENIELKGN